MSLLATFPVSVLMQRRIPNHRWADETWSAAAVLPGHAEPSSEDIDDDQRWVPGLQLELYPDENDGYFENWIAPEPKVFVQWRLLAGVATPLLVSVSYAEGTRMFDSGEHADGVLMPPEVHAWLGQYLRAHYRPREKRGRH